VREVRDAAGEPGLRRESTAHPVNIHPDALPGGTTHIVRPTAETEAAGPDLHLTAESAAKGGPGSR